MRGRPDIVAAVVVCVVLIAILVIFQPLETRLGIVLWRVATMFLIVLSLLQWRLVHARLEEHRADLVRHIKEDGDRRMRMLAELSERINQIAEAAKDEHARAQTEVMDALKGGKPE